MTYHASNKKIAKNTIVLYIRLILIMLISLYTVRVILRSLGADDYGIYNVIGGFVSLFNILSGAFAVAIARFIAYSIGEGNEKKLQDLFSTALSVQCILGSFIVFLLATIGTWYVVNIMVLPEGRITAALWVLFFSAVSFFINLMSVPFNALIIAHEHMRAYAYIAVFEVIMKLGVALAISFFPFDKLITYSFLTVVAATVVRISYSVYCNIHFSKCKFRLGFNKNMLKEMMSFIGWTFLGNGAVVFRDQGTDMILNIYGGTPVNAARAIAQIVNSAVQSFANNFLQAIQPAITKLSASNQLTEMRVLIFRSCRISYFLILILSLPLIKNIDYILTLWLGRVPEFTNIFIALTLIDSLIVALNNPLLFGVLSVGKIKTYEVTLSILCIFCLPMAYVILDFGLIPAYVYAVIIIVRLLITLTLLWQSKTYGLKWGDFYANVFSKILPVTIICIAITMLMTLPSTDITFLDFLLETGTTFLLHGIVIFLIGFSKEEKNAITDILKAKISERYSQ